MKMKLIRKTTNAKSTEGRLYVNDVFECFTLEDADRYLEKGGVKIQNKTCIPRGIYEVVWNHSEHFDKDMPLLLKVPGFEGVRIHAGNTSEDTEGCILVGALNSKDDDDFISSSKVAVSRLYPKIHDAFAVKEKITIEIV
jgi:hypothetical protein